MDNLYDILQNQLNSKYKKEAEDCIKIYNKLVEIDKDFVNGCWWNALTTPIIRDLPYVGYKPSAIGKVFLKGVLYESGEIW